jgi:hypothetical protein
MPLQVEPIPLSQSNLSKYKLDKIIKGVKSYQ